MNILFITRLFYPHIGGVEKHVEKVSQELIKKGYQITVLTEQYEGSINIKDEYQGIKIHRIPRDKLGSKWLLWQWIWQNRNFFKQFEIIHIHDVFWWLMPIIAAGNKVPKFITFHGWEGKFPPTFSAKMWRKAAMLHTKANICVGSFIEKWYEIKATKVIYGATDQQPLLLGDKDRIVVLGRISHDNDLPMVIEGLEQLKHKYPQLKITFLGDGDYAFEAEKVGKVLGTKQDISPYIEKARWVITSSYLSMTETLASGRYVFSFYSNELKKDYLITFPMASSISTARTPNEFVAKFEYAYDHKDEVDHRITAGQDWARKQKWADIAIQYEDLWTADNVDLAQQRLDKIVAK